MIPKAGLWGSASVRDPLTHELWSELVQGGLQYLGEHTKSIKGGTTSLEYSSSNGLCKANR